MTSPETSEAEVEAAAKVFWEHPSQYGDERPSWNALEELEKRADIGPVRGPLRDAARAALTAAAQVRAQAQADEIVRLRAVLEPFVEIARRLDWDKIEDDDMMLGDHVMEAPANDIAPGAVYCLMVGAFREAAAALGIRKGE